MSNWFAQLESSSCVLGYILSEQPIVEVNRPFFKNNVKNKVTGKLVK